MTAGRSGTSTGPHNLAVVPGVGGIGERVGCAAGRVRLLPAAHLSGDQAFLPEQPTPCKDHVTSERARVPLDPLAPVGTNPPDLSGWRTGELTDPRRWAADLTFVVLSRIGEVTSGCDQRVRTSLVAHTRPRTAREEGLVKLDVLTQVVRRDAKV